MNIRLIFFDKSPFDEKTFNRLFTLHPKSLEGKSVADIYNEIQGDYWSTVLEVEHLSPPPEFYHGYYGSFDKLEIYAGKGKKLDTLPLNTNPWDVFYKHATFNEILNSFEIFKNNGGDEIFKTITDIREGKTKKNIVLQFIKDNPINLHDKSIREKLIEILKIARWSNDVREREKAKNLLINNLIYKKCGGGLELPENINLLKKILEKLAFHLSKKCKKTIDCYTEQKNGKLDDDDYISLKTCAAREREYRIRGLSQDDLSTLIFREKQYVRNIMERHFRKCSKTMETYIKKYPS